MLGLCKKLFFALLGFELYIYLIILHVIVVDLLQKVVLFVKLGFLGRIYVIVDMIFAGFVPEWSAFC